MQAWFQRALAWAVAVLATAVAGSVVQTQFNLHAIAQLSEPVTLWMRLSVTAQDVMGFAPLWSLVLALALLPAFAVAAGLHHWLRSSRRVLFVLAGAVAVLTVLSVMNQLLPITPIAAARSIGGQFALTMTGLVAGLVYVRLTQRLS